MNTETKETPRVQTPENIRDNLPPELLAKLQSVVDRIAGKDGEVKFVGHDNLDVDKRLSRLLETKISDAIGGAISEVLGGLPTPMSIDILARVLAVAAATDCKEGREREMIDLIMLNFEHDFYKVRAVVLKEQADDRAAGTGLDAEEINRRAEGRYEPGTGADA